MKQFSLLNLVFIICICFTSCSNDDSADKNPDNNPSEILIKNITEEVYISNQVESSSVDFNYENGILKSTSQGIYKSELIYDGEKILKINGYKNNVLFGFFSFVYDGNLLKYTLSGQDQDEKTEYEYNNYGFLMSQKSGYMNGSQFIVLETVNYSFDNYGNITQTLENFSNGGMNIDSKKIISYDTKNNPTKFMNKYLKLTFECEGFDGLSANNKILVDSYSPISNTTPSKMRYEIIYNSDNFPTEIKKYSVSNNTLLSKTNISYQ